MSLIVANGQSIIVAGLEISSRDPLFLAIVGVHVLLGLTCTITGLIAMLSAKRPGRHPGFGSIYYWCLAGVFVTVSALAAVRWREDYHLFILGALAFAAAYLGRRARRRRWRNWAKLHITGMGMSYVLLLTAFYVDNGKSLPHWRELPPITFWLLPAAIGVPLLLGAVGLVVVVLAHICEGLHLFPVMGWGSEHSAGHYLDLASAICGFTLFPLGYLLYALHNGKR